MKKNIMIGILFLILVLSNGLNYYFSKNKLSNNCNKEEIAVEEGFILVPIAKHSLKGFTKITQEDLVYASMPKDFIDKKGAITDINSIINYNVTVYSDIKQYDFFTKENIYKETANDYNGIPSGYSKFDIEVKEELYNFARGDTVDIYFDDQENDATAYGEIFHGARILKVINISKVRAGYERISVLLPENINHILGLAKDYKEESIILKPNEDNTTKIKYVASDSIKAYVNLKYSEIDN